MLKYYCVNRGRIFARGELRERLFLLYCPDLAL